MKPAVKLISYTEDPLDLSIAAARTCYSSKGIIEPSMVSSSIEARQLRDKIAASTLKAGHLTTRQHVQFIFTLDKVSRHAVWSFFHSHPYYNSEQVSQRYVEVKKGNYIIPEFSIDHLKNVYIDAFQKAEDAYHTLTEMLIPHIRERYDLLFPARKEKKSTVSIIKKKAMETARYVLPVGTYTYLYHTINALTLYRYIKTAALSDVSDEVSTIVHLMAEEVKKIDPEFAGEFPNTAVSEEIQYNLDIDDFDQKVGDKFSKLVTYTDSSILFNKSRSQSMAHPILPDLLDSRIHPVLASMLNESIHDPFMQNLGLMQLVFQKKISHTADSQNQRHRTITGPRPDLIATYRGKPDYITPFIIKEIPEIDQYYQKFMNDHFHFVNCMLDAGMKQAAVYLLPNAFPVRFYESGNLLHLHHRWKTRSCYNAQEEIFQASLEEIREFYKLHPETEGCIGPPCLLRKRAGLKPPCPEGDRYCGVRVWEKGIHEWKRFL